MRLKNFEAGDRWGVKEKSSCVEQVRRERENFFSPVSGKAFSSYCQNLCHESPLTRSYVGKDNPPILIFHGTHDTLVPYAQSEEFAAALKEQGVEVWLQKLPGSGHGGPTFAKPSVVKLTQNFFDKHLKGADVKIELVPEAELSIAPPKAPKK